VTPNDRIILKNIKDILNPEGCHWSVCDVTWTWEDERDNWTFGLVKLTEQDAVGALALHMLHRHGLGPLLVSRAKEEFREKMSAKLQANTSMNTVKAFVEAVEECSDVVILHNLLKGLSLSGIRNLHSWDHAWSHRQGDDKMDVLQAGYSAVAHNFMLSPWQGQNAFTATARSSVRIQQLYMFIQIFKPWGYLHSTRDIIEAKDTEKGEMTIANWSTSGSNHWLASFFVGSRKAKVRVSWEGGLEDSTLKIPIEQDHKRTLQSGSVEEKTALLQDLVLDYVQQKTFEHKDYMLENRLAIWGGEEVEFFGMYKAP
jgi:hypothetical protein